MRILRFPPCLSSVYFELRDWKVVELQTLDAPRSLVSGRRILQRLNPLSTAFFTAADLAIDALPALRKTFNSLIFKEFLVPSTLEVVRIIRTWKRPSTLIS